MFFLETVKLFFDKDSRRDLFGLIVGLVALFTFSNIMMPDWAFTFFSAAMILASAVYRFVMVNDDFAENDVELLNKHNIIDYVVSKNSFVLLFTLSLFILVILFSSIIDTRPFNFNLLRETLAYTLFILGSDNIIFIFHSKPVKGYASGTKRDESEDIQTGIENFKDQIPSLFVIAFFIILFFVVGYKPSPYLSLTYYLTCLITLVYFLKQEKFLSNVLRH